MWAYNLNKPNTKIHYYKRENHTSDLHEMICNYHAYQVNKQEIQPVKLKNIPRLDICKKCLQYMEEKSVKSSTEPLFTQLETVNNEVEFCLEEIEDEIKTIRTEIHDNMYELLKQRVQRVKELLDTL